MPFRLLVAPLALLLALPALAAGAAAESGLARYRATVEAAYGHVRSAQFYLHTGNPAVANLELQDALERWRSEVLPFGASPPDAYADDTGFADALDEVARRLEKAEALSAEGAAEPAEAELAPIRPLLAELRDRNGQRVFSDCVDEANAAMDRLWEFRHATLDFTDDAQVRALRYAAAVTHYLYARCRDRAPAAVASQPEFERIVGGAVASLALLPEAIDESNAERVVNLLRELRSYDRLFWLSFG